MLLGCSAPYPCSKKKGPYHYHATSTGLLGSDYCRHRPEIVSLSHCRPPLAGTWTPVISTHTWPQRTDCGSHTVQTLHFIRRVHYRRAGESCIVGNLTNRSRRDPNNRSFFWLGCELGTDGHIYCINRKSMMPVGSRWSCIMFLSDTDGLQRPTNQQIRTKRRKRFCFYY
jgi:hypothetical protein